MGEKFRPSTLTVIVALGLLSAVVWLVFDQFIPISRQIGNATAVVQEGGEPRLDLINEVLALEGAQQELDRTLWKGEKSALEHEEIIIQLWDRLKEEEDKLRVLESFPFTQLRVGVLSPPETLEVGVERRVMSGSMNIWNRLQWSQWLQMLRERTYSIENTEWRHIRFDPASETKQARSLYWFSIHAHRELPRQRGILRGQFEVYWKSSDRPDAPPMPDTIEVKDLQCFTSQNPPEFQQVMSQVLVPEEKTFFIDPVIVHDLDQNGLNDILMVAKNVVFFNQGDMQFSSDTLCQISPGLIFTGVIGDFNGDSFPDLLCADREGLLLVRGEGKGVFRTEPMRVWTAPETLQYVQVLNAGDIDRDHDLDIWVGQYKLPYKKGQMPTPYYDANDGHPSWLLVNEGTGFFKDATEGSGLEAKRYRRLYSSSFVDWDGDGDLDLMNISDFAGVDLFENQGGGVFRDVTGEKLDKTHGFGMAHGVTDFNRDGLLDFYMIGMNSSAASRLDHLGLGHPEFPNYSEMRAPMTYGNRFYLGQQGGFLQAPFNDQVAATGWSWGAVTFDFENDGDLDIYITNGHESFASVRDYESFFWRHDLYLANSEADPVLDLFFNFMGTQLRGGGMSYGGYEKNRFYLKHEQLGYVDTAHLHGVAMEQDSRNVVAEDLDKDGRMDLVWTTFEAWPHVQQTVQVYSNQREETGHWIGVELANAPDGCSPIGAVVKMETPGRTEIRTYVTGASYRSQGAPAVHFGLGQETRVERLHIQFACGETVEIREPTIDQWHRHSN